MNASFDELLKTVDKVMELCPWTSEQSVESYARQIQSEAHELMNAVENNDDENLKEELGDLFWDVIITAKLAEKEGKFQASDIMNAVVRKMHERKPYLAKNQKVSLEEAERLWAIAKNGIPEKQI